MDMDRPIASSKLCIAATLHLCVTILGATLLGATLFGATAAQARTGESVQVDTLRSYATLHSIGFEWDIHGDADHDATCTVRYRPSGSEAWQSALDLMRVDYHGYYGDTRADRAYNMLAGSLFFLSPGTLYEVELTLDDPDGGSVQRRVQLSTQPEPSLPGGSVLYVHSDPTPGDGTRDQPLTLGSALAREDAGVTYCLLPGEYGQIVVDQSGLPAAPIAWLGPAAARDAGYDVATGDAVFERIEVSASDVWFEGLVFHKGQAWPDSVTRGALRGQADAARVIVRGNRFLDYSYSIWLDPGNRAWVISDNTIVGRKDIEQEGSAAFSGEGIELQHSSDHTVAYNSISQVADGVSYAQRNVDIFGNDIFDTSDDGLEPDYGYANIRMWGNRIANVQYHAFSFQGMYCGPWYFIRNQVTTARGALFKFRTASRLVFVNNTLVAPTFGRDIMHHLLHGLVRNNLFIADGTQEREPWRARRKYVGDAKEHGYYTPDLTTPDWRTEWDYSGYDLNTGRFHWFDESFERVEDLALAAGIETHGRQIEREATFVDYKSPTNPARQPRPVLSLRPDGAAVDAGEPVPNLTNGFIGSAPDLGAFEVGGAKPHFGPRQPAQRHVWLRIEEGH
ncbi:MAG: hypothetical protein HOM68_01505 [Gemmatimonadetes bacterium]|nr:hypothetical protein [Gemmatimonadota bacterium]MBT5055188.1 hypothetical protein [Gemmatimonadota bacterium]MBT5145327.1 hypothetical protein [Gemmatimonadota bacterium]MBT5591515.1 hypothetical protein [Gemmatimonadota bacterium]MBT5962030.1 hypothetical protein [Gemmatimonadota bacterium]